MHKSFLLCYLCYSNIFASLSENDSGKSVSSQSGSHSTTTTFISQDKPKGLENKKTDLEQQGPIIEQHQDTSENFLEYIATHIKPLENNFKNYIIPACAKISSTGALIIAGINYYQQEQNTPFPEWINILTAGITFTANFAWLVQHISDKNQVQLFLNKTNNVAKKTKK